MKIKMRIKMKILLLQWIAWACFLIAVVSISDAIVRYADHALFNAPHEIFVCIISSICLTIWYKFFKGKS